MNFKLWIEQEKNFNRLKRYCAGTLRKLNKTISQEEIDDVFSFCIEWLVVNKPEIEEIESFIKGYFATMIKNHYFGLKRKDKISKEVDVFSLDIEDKEYQELDVSKIIDNLEVLKCEEKVYNVIYDRYYNGLKPRELFKKYNINTKDLEKYMRKAEQILEGRYNGVAQLDIEGNIIAVYESCGAVKRGNFDPSKVNSICNKTHKGSGIHKEYFWQWVKDLKHKTGSING